MSRPLKMSKNVTTGPSSTVTLKAGPIGVSTLGGNQIRVRFKTGGVEYDGYITKQKGSKIFICSDGTHTAKCKLVDKANAALVNSGDLVGAIGDMTITATKQSSATFRVSKITRHRVSDFSSPAVKFAWTLSGSASSTSTPLETVTLAVA